LIPKTLVKLFMSGPTISIPVDRENLRIISNQLHGLNESGDVNYDTITGYDGQLIMNDTHEARAMFTARRPSPHRDNTTSCSGVCKPDSMATVLSAAHQNQMHLNVEALKA
jgi:hypothetical protein